MCFVHCDQVFSLLEVTNGLVTIRVDVPFLSNVLYGLILKFNLLFV